MEKVFFLLRGTVSISELRLLPNVSMVTQEPGGHSAVTAEVNGF